VVSVYKKHHPPSLFDEVWRLEKIGKDGAFHKRLSRENINSVKDFLTLLFIDPSRLRYVRIYCFYHKHCITYTSLTYFTCAFGYLVQSSSFYLFAFFKRVHSLHFLSSKLENREKLLKNKNFPTY
jgi:hypothetical protein